MKDAWGADWGKYHRSKHDIKKPHKRNSSIYLLYKLTKLIQDNKNTYDVVIKVGKTKRSPEQRAYEHKGGFHVMTSWLTPEDILTPCEKYVIEYLKINYGAPIEGRETFLVNDLQEIKDELNIEITKFIKNNKTEISS